MVSPVVKEEWRTHWRVVFGTFFAMALAYPAWSFTQSQFVQPLQAEFGWSRSQIALAFGSNIFIAWAAPAYGWTVDRFGVRPVLSVCLPLLALAYIIMANVPPSYPVFFAASLLLTVAGMGTTGIAFTRAIVGWFSASRGTALAISRIGMSLGGAFLPIVVFHVIADTGWRNGFYLLAGLALFLSLPLSLLFVRDRRPTPEERVANEATGRGPTAGMRLWITLLRDKRVLILSLAAASTYGPCIGVLSQLQPLLVSKNLDPSVAATLSALLAGSVTMGVLISGLLVDRIWAPLVAFTFTMLPVAGCMVLLMGAPGIVLAGLAVVLIGFAQGAEIDLVAYMVARYFGMQAYAAIYGLTVLVTTIFTTLGAVLFGASYDVFGSYNPALIGAAVVFAVAACLYLLMGRYPETPGLRIQASVVA